MSSDEKKPFYEQFMKDKENLKQSFNDILKVNLLNEKPKLYNKPRSIWYNEIGKNLVLESHPE